MEVKTQQIGAITVVHVSGKLNLEKTPSFRDACLKSLRGQKVVFCLQGLQFVGSSGIQTFFKALSDIQDSGRCHLKVSNVSQDFQRVLQYASLPNLEILPSLETAVSRFSSVEFSN